MCRWNAYFGQPVMIEELLFRTEHSLIDQSLHSRMGVETTNGDGFGLGWYTAGNGGAPARYPSGPPAGGDPNPRALAPHAAAPPFLPPTPAPPRTPAPPTH